MPQRPKRDASDGDIIKPKQRRANDATFLTSVADGDNKKTKGSMSKVDLEATALQEYTNKEKIDQDEGRASDIDFNDEYSDDEMDINFKNSRDVITYLHNLEDDNLFKVTVNQTDEENLEQVESASAKQIKAMQEQLRLADEGIDAQKQMLETCE